MEYRKLGNSDLNVSAVTFGAWAAGGWMWGGTERSEAVEAIRAGFDYGVTSIDTAPAYGQGTSEEIVGEAIKGMPRDKIQILTKYGLSWEGTKGEFFFNSKNNQGKPIDIYRYSGKESIIKECETSLRLLGTDYIDLYQIHWADPTTPVQETMEAVAQLIKEGKVRYAGVCNYDVSLMKEAAKYINLVSDQVSYSMVKRDIEQDLVPYLIENNKSVLAYSPLQRGLLSGKIKPGHLFAEGDTRIDQPYYSDQNITLINAFLQKIKPLADDKKATLSQLVIRWTIEQPGITIALVGARNAAQSVENAKAAQLKLSSDEINFMNAELDKLKLDL
ncbi:L-fuco-beta-pyranose dehydrogenase [Aquipluma nitroreducens]|uniref:L-fuco-beta-pyranose dehydrogenase n=1 Tax=Aquipluma nitroreducens TaxID=2010828 RepID=A0A5K7SBS1_9BACT|nr:aldo/keto reductase [Aquipluma nitroreducens]BBE18929.1 L-fuco-beta-pyranose dehydrogenase [Aquipluma nitroreducens]